MASSIKVSKTSRYVGTPVYRVFDNYGYPTNNYYFGVWNRPNIDLSVDSGVYHTVSEHEIGRLDLVAYDYYGDPLLWWVIADANQISDQFTEVQAGQVIFVPNLDIVSGALQEASRK